MTTVGDYIFLPWRPNWKNAVAWNQTWDTRVVQAVTGVESREALRVNPRVQLSWLVSAWTQEQEQELQVAIRAAKKAGLACAPYWGRASEIVSEGMDYVATETPWDWKAGDWVYFEDGYLTQVGAVNTVDGLVRLAVPPGHSVHHLCWPLIFGKFTSGDESVITAQRGEITLTVTEQTSRDAEQLGVVVPDDSTAIGHGSIAGTFQIAVVEIS